MKKNSLCVDIEKVREREGKRERDGEKDPHNFYQHRFFNECAKKIKAKIPES